jgi:hypothetical protein
LRRFAGLVCAGAIVYVPLSQVVFTESDAHRELPQAPVLTSSPILLASLERVWRGSVLWRDAVVELRRTGRRVVVGTPADVHSGGWYGRQSRKAFDPSLLAEVVPLLRPDSGIALAVVVVNVPLIRRIHEERLTVLRDFEADLDRIIIHEVYGHAIPLLLAGDLSGRCPDPKPGERADEACSIRRENAVRAELGLGTRSDEGLSSLTLARALPFTRTSVD